MRFLLLSTAATYRQVITPRAHLKHQRQQDHEHTHTHTATFRGQKTNAQSESHESGPYQLPAGPMLTVRTPDVILIIKY